MTDPHDRQLWAIRAGNAAILGSCARSMPSVKTGISKWKRFATQFLGLPHPYPAPLYGLLAWSRTFRCTAWFQVVFPLCAFLLFVSNADTFGNYLSYARIGSLLAREPDEVFDAKALSRAKVSRPLHRLMYGSDSFSNGFASQSLVTASSEEFS